LLTGKAERPGNGFRHLSVFVNFDQRDIDFAELERLELELLKESMKDDLELADHV